MKISERKQILRKINMVVVSNMTQWKRSDVIFQQNIYQKWIGGWETETEADERKMMATFLSSTVVVNCLLCCLWWIIVASLTFQLRKKTFENWSLPSRDIIMFYSHQPTTPFERLTKQPDDASFTKYSPWIHFSLRGILSFFLKQSLNTENRRSTDVLSSANFQDSRGDCFVMVRRWSMCRSKQLFLITHFHRWKMWISYNTVIFSQERYDEIFSIFFYLLALVCSVNDTYVGTRWFLTIFSSGSTQFSSTFPSVYDQF